MPEDSMDDNKDRQDVGQNMENKKVEAVTGNPTTTDPIATGGDMDTVQVKSAKKSFLPKLSKKVTLITVAVVLVLAGGSAGAYWYMNKEEPADTQESQVVQQEEQPKEEPKQETEAIPEDLAKFIKPTTGETWLDAPVALPDQGFYIGTALATEYYEVGKRDQNSIIMAKQNAIGDIIRLFEKSPSGAVELIARPDNLAVYNEEDEQYLFEELSEAVTVNTTTGYDSLSIPRQITINDKLAVNKSTYPYLGDYITADSSADYKKVKTYGESTLSKVEYKYPDTDLTSIGYAMELPINTRVGVVYQPLDLDAKDIQWSSGSSYVSVDFLPISRGCGGLLNSSVSRVNGLTQADLVSVGKTVEGDDVYHFVDSKHPVVKKAYDEFKEWNESQLEFSRDVPYQGISLEDFIREHAVIVFKDKQGEFLVYSRNDMRPAYGCAKPVVYLYPERNIDVKVKVGADVKVSEPFYNPLLGWTVSADPSGELTLNGVKYDSLFWEGPGWGEYPIVNEGVVVKSENAISVIKSQLKQQGLNAKEIADFVEYWEPNLPEKPYTRLTWLNTDHLEKLAPLYISPQPQTMIRVFLDYEGHDNYFAMKPQKFESLKRDGFTVVEWGGLAKKALY